MKSFPIGYCVKTSLLTKSTHDWLITRLVSEGYTVLGGIDKSVCFELWLFIGVNSHAEVQYYDYPHSYLRINEWQEKGYIKGYNVLTEDQLKSYLGEVK